MTLKRSALGFFALLGCFALVVGCQSGKPVSPAGVASLKVSLPMTGEFQSSLLGSAQNKLLYRVDSLGADPIEGSIGPFTNAASSGSIDFSLDVPLSSFGVLSLQLNDDTTQSPLAVGASAIDLSSDSTLVVEMGSVTRNCYTLKVSGGAFPGETYSFVADNLPSTITRGPLYDIGINYSAGSANPLIITDAQAVGVTLSTIAYLGNGDLIDHSLVPAATSFFQTSALAKGAPVSVGDIFYLKLGTIPGAHAWFQVTKVGNGTLYQGPEFRYRVNSTKPYFAYQRTAPDTASACSTMW